MSGSSTALEFARAWNAGVRRVAYSVALSLAAILAAAWVLGRATNYEVALAAISMAPLLELVVVSLAFPSFEGFSFERVGSVEVSEGQTRSGSRDERDERELRQVSDREARPHEDDPDGSAQHGSRNSGRSGVAFELSPALVVDASHSCGRVHGLREACP